MRYRRLVAGLSIIAILTAATGCAGVDASALSGTVVTHGNR